MKATFTNIVESFYSSCHFCQFANNSLRELQGLIQPKDEWLPLLDAKKIGAQIRFFWLACVVKISWYKNKKTLVPKNKTHLLKQSIFVKTKYEHKKSVCQQSFLTFVMLEKFDTYRLPNSNPVLCLDLRMNYDRDVKQIYFKTVPFHFLVVSRWFEIRELVEW